MKQQSGNRGEGQCEHHRRVLEDGQWFYPFGSGVVIEAHRRAADGDGLGRDGCAPPMHNEAFPIDGLEPGIWKPVQGQFSSYREEE